ncbi:MAG: hypothetical protein JTT11_03170 [Candidatus Brockarchaeota archaeon]|nr:hypothetical protein [Candidatus Brockarchaeota archaeon]
MSVPYVPSSMKNLDKDGDGVADHLQFAVTNKVESGSASIGVKLQIDGVDFTDRGVMQIGSQKPQKLGPYLYISTNYGDKCVVEVEHGGKIKAGKHKVRMTVSTPVGTFTSEFEDTA